MALVTCEKCNGTGIVSGDLGDSECPECRGIGQKETDWVGTIPEIRRMVNEVEPILKALDPKVDALAVSQTAQDIEIASIKTMCEKIDNIKNKCDNIKDKCDQIWDKVKDL